MLNFRISLVIATATATLALAGIGCGDDIKCHSEPVDPAQEVHRCVCMDGDDEDSTVLFTAGSTDVHSDCYVKPSASADGGGGAGGDGGDNTCTNLCGDCGSCHPDCSDCHDCGACPDCGGCPPGPTCTTEVCDGVDNDCDGQVDEGCNDPPPPVGGWQLCWLPPPNQSLLLDTSWYLQQAQAYRNGTINLYCMSLGSYQEFYGAETAGTWLVVNQAEYCEGTVNLLAGNGMRVLGGAASGTENAVFDQYDDALIGFLDLGGCAVAALTQGGIDVWISAAPTTSNLTGDDVEMGVRVWGGSSSMDDQLSAEITNVIQEPPASFK